MLNQDELVKRVKCLVPDAKCSLRKKEVMQDALYNHDICDYHEIDGVVIEWRKDNAKPFPDVAALRAVADKDVVDMEAKDLKETKKLQYKQNLALVALFLAAKENTPDLDFCEFCDKIYLSADKI